MNQSEIEKMKKEYFKKGGVIIVLPANTYSDGIKRFDYRSHFPKGRKALTADRGQGTAQANLIYSGNLEG